MKDQEEGTVAKDDIVVEPQEAQTEYIPSSPQYVPASDDESEMSSDKDLEALYLAPKGAKGTPSQVDPQEKTSFPSQLLLNPLVMILSQI